MRSQRKIFLLVLSVVLIGAAAAGIVVWRLRGSSTVPAATPSSSPSSDPTRAVSPPDELITTNDLYRAPVPSLCGHPAGTLVDGSLPGIPAGQGHVELLAKSKESQEALVFGDLTSDGGVDVAALLGCSQGGVDWPQQVVLYTPGPKVLGAVDLGALTTAEHADVEQMTIKSGDVSLAWKSYDGAGFCVKKWSARLHWDGQKVAVLGLVQAPPTGPLAPGADC